MPFFCNKCGINWAVLHSDDDEASCSTYEFCPKCRNDMDLTEGHDGPSYVMQAFGGNILDALTRQPMLQEKARNYAIQEAKMFDRPAWEERKSKQVSKEDEAIDAYIRACESGGQKAGEEAFFNTLKK